MGYRWGKLYLASRIMQSGMNISEGKRREKKHYLKNMPSITLQRSNLKPPKQRNFQSSCCLSVLNSIYCASHLQYKYLWFAQASRAKIQPAFDIGVRPRLETQSCCVCIPLSTKRIKPCSWVERKETRQVILWSDSLLPP